MFMGLSETFTEAMISLTWPNLHKRLSLTLLVFPLTLGERYRQTERLARDCDTHTWGFTWADDFPHGISRSSVTFTDSRATCSHAYTSFHILTPRKAERESTVTGRTLHIPLHSENPSKQRFRATRTYILFGHTAVRGKAGKF